MNKLRVFFSIQIERNSHVRIQYRYSFSFFLFERFSIYIYIFFCISFISLYAHTHSPKIFIFSSERSESNFWNWFQVRPVYIRQLRQWTNGKIIKKSIGHHKILILIRFEVNLYFKKKISLLFLLRLTYQMADDYSLGVSFLSDYCQKKIFGTVQCATIQQMFVANPAT